MCTVYRLLKKISMEKISRWSTCYEISEKIHPKRKVHVSVSSKHGKVVKNCYADSFLLLCK